MEVPDSNVTSTTNKESVFIPGCMNLKIKTYPTAKYHFQSKNVHYLLYSRLTFGSTYNSLWGVASSKHRFIDVLMSTVYYYSFCTVHRKTVSGYVIYSILTSDAATCLVKLFDKSLSLVAQSPGCQGNLTVTNAHLWWPALTCNETPGYLYSLKVGLTAIQCNVLHRLNSR